MKKLFLFLCLFFSIATNAQELCANGIDDDGDGLIDINDTADCKCSGIGVGLPSSLIRNPSFEEYTSCPAGYSQLDRCKYWIQATTATSDYQNTCGWSFPGAGPAGVIPPPDGVGWVGAYIMTGYKEYVGSCLTGPLLTTKTYKIRFHIASSLFTGMVIPCEPVNITIYGANSCADLPVATLGCPSSASAAWTELGHVTYTPSVSWKSQEIVFTPTVEINSIILGPPCVISACYATGNPYLYFDNLIINESALFAPFSITKTGHYCLNDIVLSPVLFSVPSATATYQWYKNGIAISGATSTTYSVPGGLPGVGSYEVMITDAGDCTLSSKYNITVDPPPVLISSVSPTTICEGKSADLQVSGAKTYTWSSGATTFSTSVSPVVTSFYTVTGVDSIGCKSVESLTVHVINPKIVVSSATICLGQSVTLNASGLNTYTWSTGSLSNSTTITPSVTTTYSVDGTDVLGCKTSETASVEVIHTIANYDGFEKSSYEFGTSVDLINKSLDAIDYQWIYCSGSVSTNTDVTVALQDSGNCCMKLIAKKFQCTDTISKCFYVIPEAYVIIPNVFTPNGDNANEVFKIKSFGMKDLNCVIFDRWGLKMYEWDGLYGYWDGVAKSGPAPSGTYYYIVRYSSLKGAEKTEKGFLTLFKD